MSLLDDLERIAALAAPHAPGGHEVGAVLAAEPDRDRRFYLCAFTTADERRAWLVLDESGDPLSDRRGVRDVVSIAALCEIAGEAVAGGELDELLAQLEALRIAEAPEGIDEAEAAARALQGVIGVPPRLATPTRLDEIGQATRRLEQALDPAAGSPFAAAMRGAQGTVDELLAEVESTYLAPLV